MVCQYRCTACQCSEQEDHGVSDVGIGLQSAVSFLRLGQYCEVWFGVENPLLLIL